MQNAFRLDEGNLNAVIFPSSFIQSIYIDMTQDQNVRL